jgi:hypothetical protein
MTLTATVLIVLLHVLFAQVALLQLLLRQVATYREVYRMGFPVYRLRGIQVSIRSCACRAYIRLDPEKRE